MKYHIPYSTKVSRDKTFAVRSPCEYSRKNFRVCISIAQKFRGTKLSWLDHDVNSKNLSVCIKNVHYSIHSRSPSRCLYIKIIISACSEKLRVLIIASLA